MARERKWVYWHRVMSVIDEDKLKVGQLLGLEGKDEACMRLAWNEQKKTFEMKDCTKLIFLGRMLRTATGKEVHDAFEGKP
jgi:hypothetical protein